MQITSYLVFDCTLGFNPDRVNPRRCNISTFTLVVDVFGIKYVGNEHAEHLVSVLKKDYVCSED